MKEIKSSVVYVLGGNHSWPQPQLHGELHRWLVQHVTGAGANTLHRTEVRKAEKGWAPLLTRVNSHWIKGGNKGDHTAKAKSCKDWRATLLPYTEHSLD